MSVLKIKDSSSGQWTGIPSIQGDKGETGGVNDAVALSLLRIANAVWYEDDKGKAYVQALKDALYPPADLVSLSAVYTQSGDVYDLDSIDVLKDGLVVTATMTGGTTQTIPADDYFVDGEMRAGTQTFTVSYRGKTAQFSALIKRKSTGLVDGVYQVQSETGITRPGTAQISNGSFTGVDMTPYLYVYVPLRNPIKLFAGDTVIFSNGAAPIGDRIQSSPYPVINGDTSLYTLINAYAPFYPRDGKITVNTDVVVNLIRFQTGAGFNGTTFTMSMKVNGEVVF